MCQTRLTVVMENARVSLDTETRTARVVREPRRTVIGQDGTFNGDTK